MNIDMTDELRRLTWKHFWRQKGEEIGKFLFFVFIFISIASVLFQLGWICKNSITDVCQTNIGGGETCTCAVPYQPSLPRWVMYSGFGIIFVWIIIGLSYWIKSNWREAKVCAEIELDSNSINLMLNNKKSERRSKNKNGRRKR